MSANKSLAGEDPEKQTEELCLTMDIVDGYGIKLVFVLKPKSLDFTGRIMLVWDESFISGAKSLARKLSSLSPFISSTLVKE